MMRRKRASREEVNSEREIPCCVRAVSIWTAWEDGSMEDQKRARRGMDSIGKETPQNAKAGEVRPETKIPVFVGFSGETAERQAAMAAHPKEKRRQMMNRLASVGRSDRFAIKPRRI